MRTLITIFTCCLAYYGLRAPKPQPILQQQHIQYIQDSIQPPIPQHPIQIEIRVAILPPTIIGQTYPINHHQYLILLNPVHRSKWSLTLLHELVHVKQFRTKRLQYNEQTSQWYWLGQPCNWSTAWSQRPWEQEADRQALQYSITQ